jgi:hypothetical protein
MADETTFLTDCVSLLAAIGLPDLTLPPARFEKADRDRVAFGIRYYVYASIAQHRSVLKGLVLVADGANWACAYILTRHLLEWAAQATFAKLKLTSLVRQQKWDKAWAVLLKLNGGDLYFRQFGAKYLQDREKDVNIPEPYGLADFMAVYDSQWAAEDGRGAAKEDHSLLSELSHASAACLRQQLTTYHNRISFKSEEDNSSLSAASTYCIDWLMSIAEMLKSIDDSAVGPAVMAAVRRLAEG